MANDLQVFINVKSNADEAARGLDRLESSVVSNLKVAERLEKDYKLLDRAFNKGRISAQLYAKGIQQVDRAIDDALNGTKQATAAINQNTNATKAAATAMNQYGKVSAIGGKNLNRTNMIIQQSGYQLQDFAVQIQSGTNAFVALGQQGSQLLGLFGAKGAILGAFLAIGTAIARMGTSGKQVSFDFKGFGQAMAKSFEPIQPAIDNIVKAFKFLGQIAIEAVNLVVNAASLLYISLAGIIDIAVEVGSRSGDAFRFLAAKVWQVSSLIVKFMTEAMKSSLEAILGFANNAVAAYVGLKDSVVAVFGLIPSAVGDLTIRAVNGILSSIENLLNSVIRNVNNFLQKIDQAIPDWMKGDGAGLGNITEINIDPITNKFAGAASNAGQEIAKAFSDAFGREFVSSDLPFLEGFLAKTEKNIEGARREAKILARALGEPVESVERLFEALSEYEYIDIREFFEMVAEKSKESGEKAKNAYLEAMMTAKEFADALDQQVIGAVDGVADAFSTFLQNGMKDFRSFVGSIKDMFIKLLADMAVMALKRKILIPITTSFMAGMGSDAAASALPKIMGNAIGGSADGGGFFGSMLGSIAGGAGAFGSGIMAGIQGFAGGFANGGGLIGGLSGYGATLSAASANAGIMGTLGVALPAIAAVSVVVGLFTKKVKELDNGLRVTIDGTDTLVESYRKLKTTRLFGLISSKSTEYEEAPSETADPIIQAVAEIQDSVVNMATGIGVGADAFNDFAYQFKVSLKGLSEEEAIAALQKEFEGVTEAMAELVPDLSSFSREGESLSQTLSRLYTDLSVVNNTFDSLGRSALDASMDMAAAASDLIAAAGGVNAYISKTQTLVDTLYDTQEQLDIYTNALGDTFGGTVPTKEEVKGILESGTLEELETLYGADTISTLTKIYDLQNQIAQEELARAEEAQRIADAAADAAKDAAKAEAEAAERAAAEAQRERERKAAEAEAERERVLNERLNLETRILQLQGNTAELRRRELAALDPSNRALQEMIYKLEDAKKAMDDLNEEDFSTLVDYQRAMARAAAEMNSVSIPTGGTGVSNPAMPITLPGERNDWRGRDPRGERERDRERRDRRERNQEQFEADMITSMATLNKWAKRTSDSLRKFDVDGLPAERT